MLGACAAATLALAACETVQTTQPGVVGVTRTQRMAVSSPEIEQASARAYATMLQQAAAQGILDLDAGPLARVRSVATRLIGQVGACRPEARRWPRSRQAELEADRIGVELAARAGSDPRAAGGDGPPAFLSTHPAPAAREAELSRAAQLVMPLYRQAVAGR